MQLSSVVRSGLAALALALCASSASAEPLKSYDLNKLNSWSDALAVCDVSRFLLSDPNLSADAIVVPGGGNTHTVLYAPLYAPPTNFFSKAMREAYANLERAGLVSLDSFSTARLHYAREMLDSYRSASMSDKKFLKDQMDLCYHLAARTGVKLAREQDR